MTTKNIVPRADGEGELGTSSKKWSKVQAVTGSFDHIQTTTMASEIYTSGSTKFGDTSDDTHQFTGSVLVDGSVTASDDLFVGDDLIVAGEVNVAGRLRPNAHIDFDNSAGYIRDNQTQPRIGWPTNTSDTLLYNSSGTHAEITIGDTEVTFAGNITASGHVSASAFYGDGTGITGVTAEWDGSHDGDAEITGSLFVKAADGGGFNLVGDNGTTSGSILHSFGGVTIGNSTTAAIGLFNFGPEVFMSNTSASVSVDGAHITMSPGAGGAAKVNGDSEVSGTLAVSASSGVTSFNPNGINWITGSSVTLAAPAINLKNGDVTVGVDGESRQVTVNGHLSASLNITASGHVSASAFYGDGTGITGVTAEWDGTRNGDAEITGTLTVSGSGNTAYLYLGGPLADVAPGSSNLQIGYDPSTGIDSSVWFGPAGGSAKGIISYANSSDEFQFKADEFDFNGLGTSTLISVSGNIATTGQIYNSGEDKGTETADFTIDWDEGMTQELILSGAASTTLTASFSNVKPYTTYQLIHKIGKDNMAIYFDHPAGIYWPGGTRPTLSTTSGSVDVLTFTTDGSSNIYGVAQYNFSASVG